MKEKFALSWSGGKDACMALHRLKEQGVDVAVLVTTVPEEMGRTFGHGEKSEMVTLQGEALSIPIYFIQCTYKNYQESFVNALIHLQEEYGITGIAFGDLYLDEHRDWGEEVATEAGLKAVYPLWTTKEDSLEALRRFVNSGYKAMVIRVRDDALDQSWIGREVDEKFVEDIQKEKICPMGELGEYHTYVYDGPMFKKKILLKKDRIILFEKSRKLEFSGFELA